MRKTRTLLLASILLVLSGFPALGGDFSTLNFIGFSKDGRFLAFEEYGVADGSGFPYSSFYFIDVEKNFYAAPAVHVRIERETATEQQARSRAKLNAAANLRKFRIVDRNIGKLVVTRLLTDVSVNHFFKDADDTQTINFAELIASMYRDGDYDLILKPVSVKTKECDIFDQPIYKFDLTLRDNNAEKTIVLQRDSALPASRSCPLHYAIQYVYLYESYIVVFLNSYSTGFEGPDMRYLAVTGRFK